MRRMRMFLVGLSALVIAVPLAGTADAVSPPIRHTRSMAAVAAPDAAGFDPTPQYYGGPVISNVELYQIIYGNGSFMPEVVDTDPNGHNFVNFFNAVVTSPYVGLLTEYNTPTQEIGYGTFKGQIAIKPARARNGPKIFDEQVRAELVAQIKAGVIPAPTVDADGNTNTMYEIFFRTGQQVCASFGCSGVVFCGYHSTMRFGTMVIQYTIEPDSSTYHGGCGGPTAFDAMLLTASHELIETITDPQVGFVTVLGPPLAWYEPNYGEIADFCFANGSITGADGQTYTVQKYWSEVLNHCTDGRAN